MNCREATDHMDRMIFDQAPADPGLMHHIETCSSCSKTYSDALKAMRMMEQARRYKPELNDPEGLTDDIMAATGRQTRKKVVVPVLWQRLLAAASVALVLVFGYEQYSVVDKVSTLEIQCSQVKAGWLTATPLQLASAIDINQAGFYSPLISLLHHKRLNQHQSK
jgi:hypothetical protein